MKKIKLKKIVTGSLLLLGLVIGSFGNSFAGENGCFYTPPPYHGTCMKTVEGYYICRVGEAIQDC